MEKKVLNMVVEVGNDNGNSEHDIIIDGVSIEQPNVFAKIRKLPLLDEVKIDYAARNIHDNLLATVTSPSAEPGIYFSGNYALNSGAKVRSIEVGVDNNKIKSSIPVINTLERIAGECVKRAYENGEDISKLELKIEADMTTALPVTQYSKKNADEFSSKFMKEEHMVIVHVGNIDVKCTIKFPFVKTLPESVPATFAFQSMYLKEAESGKEKEIEKHNKEVKELFGEFNKQFSDETDIDFIDGKFFENKRILHVGIGEGTTEYPLTNGIEFDPNFIHGSNNGIGHAIDKALPEFQDELGLLDYSRQKYSEVLRDPKHRYNSIASEIVEQYIEEQAEDILTHIKAEIQRANNEIDIVAIYGGGSIPMKEILFQKVKAICDRAHIKLFYVPAKYAVTLESRGMYEFVTGPIFKALKAKHLNIAPSNSK